MRLAISKTQKLPQNFISFFVVFFVLFFWRGVGWFRKREKKGTEFIIKLAEIIVVTALIK